MSYTIVVDDQRKLIRIKSSGMITLQDRAQAVEEGSGMLSRSGYRKVLVDLSDAVMAYQSPKEESEFAEVLSRYETLKHCRTAFLVKDQESCNEFIEILAKARRNNSGHMRADRPPAKSRIYLDDCG